MYVHVREARENKNSAILEGIVSGVIPGEGKSQIQGPDYRVPDAVGEDIGRQETATNAPRQS